MDKERKAKCIQVFNTEIIFIQMLQSGITYAQFFERFENSMIEKTGSCTDEDKEFAIELMERWEKKNC